MIQYVEIKKKRIIGKTGRTVIYSPDIVFSNGVLSWNKFNFYGIGGTNLDKIQTDENGNEFIEIESGEISINRDDYFDKTIDFVVTMSGDNSLIINETIDGIDQQGLVVDVKLSNSTDIIATVSIPWDETKTPCLLIKEVSNEV